MTCFPASDIRLSVRTKPSLFYEKSLRGAWISAHPVSTLSASPACATDRAHHLLPRMTGQPACRLRVSRAPSGVWLKKRSASPALGLIAMPSWAHVEKRGSPSCCGHSSSPGIQGSGLQDTRLQDTFIALWPGLRGSHSKPPGRTAAGVLTSLAELGPGEHRRITLLPPRLRVPGCEVP